MVVNDTGDMPGDSSHYDLCEVYVANDMSYLYIAMFMRGTTYNYGLWAYLDVDRSATTGFNINDIGAEYLIANGVYDELLSWHSQNNSWIPVETPGYSRYLSFNGNGWEWTESRIDLASFGSPLLIDLVFAAVGGGTDVAPNVGHVTYATSDFHNIAVTNVTASKNIVGQGYSLNINLTVANQGSYAEAFNVTVYANTTMIETKEVALASRNTTNTIFTWNTTGFAKGNYTLSAYATPVPGEINTADNMLSDGWVFVSIPGDINADRKVDLKDVFAVGKAYGSVVGDLRYKPNLDINGDGKIDLKDYFTACKNYGKSW
jgi:hypothetical protein